MCANARCFIVLLTLVVVGLLGACSDLPTGPESVEVLSEVLSKDELVEIVRDYAHVKNSPSRVVVVERKKALKKDVSASAFIGPKGGRIRLKKAGLTIYFPKGALLDGTEITILAPAGKLLGYSFLPHGLVFQKPVIVTQDLRKIKGSLNAPLLAAYYEGTLRPSVIAKELRAFKKHGRIGGLGVFVIEHFSGYVIATD